MRWRPEPLSFLEGGPVTLSLAARWGLLLVPVGVVVGSVAQRWSAGPATALLAIAVVALIPFVADAFAIRVPDFVCLVLVGGSVYVLLTKWVVPSDLSPFLLVVMAAVGAVITSPTRSLLGALASCAVPIAVDLSDHYDGGLLWVAGILFGWLAGIGIRTQLDLVTKLEEANRALAEQATSEERRRIAGELHDVVAHSLAVTMLHLTGARLALETDDRDEALGALRDAERFGRASLADIRRSVGLLTGGAGSDPALPAASELLALVEQFREAGLDVRLDLHGELGRVSAASGLALYRIAQESLANVVKHSPGAGAEVKVMVDSDGVRLRVGNDIAVPAVVGSTSPSASTGDDGAGWGLLGMRERAESLGGTFDAASAGGRWVVEATLPP